MRKAGIEREMWEQEEIENGAVLIGQRLVELRNKNQMTQEDLSEKLGVSRQAISKWESNRTFPGIDKILMISELYQVSLDYLLKGVDDQPEQIKNRETEICLEEEKALPVFEEKEAVFEETEETSGKTEALLEGEEAALPERTEDVPVATEITLEKRRERRYSGKPLGIRLASILIVILLIANCVIIGTLLINQSWNVQNGTAAFYVDTIYEQYTKAKVVVPQEDGSYTEKVLWLDSEGVHENDWGFCYNDGEPGSGIKVNYNMKTLLIPVTTAGILLVLLLLLRIDMRK